jgi:hypothetical protein
MNEKTHVSRNGSRPLVRRNANRKQGVDERGGVRRPCATSEIDRERSPIPGERQLARLARFHSRRNSCVATASFTNRAIWAWRRGIPKREPIKTFPIGFPWLNSLEPYVSSEAGCMASRRLLNGDDNDGVDRRAERGRTEEKEE